MLGVKEALAELVLRLSKTEVPLRDCLSNSLNSRIPFGVTDVGRGSESVVGWGGFSVVESVLGVLLVASGFMSVGFCWAGVCLSFNIVPGSVGSVVATPTPLVFWGKRSLPGSSAPDAGAVVLFSSWAEG